MRVSGRTLRPVFKVWLDRDGKAFGEGPQRLLEGVDRTGSLRQAAMELNMSYNKAWRLLRALEDKLGFALLERSAGGLGGGGSQLTEGARDLMRRFAALEQEAGAAVDAAFHRHFPD
ncbi:MAG: Molybdenum-pterin-binding protein MopA [Actinobacteria bacterium ADurb.Bin444]|nr:MAG: Molybdenum-pterin-binding protein MopA [Actinobacteria bacterium ADurb.Bin444]